MPLPQAERRFFSVAIMLALVPVVTMPAMAEEPAPAEVRRAFETPAKAFRPMARWWWPGNDVTPQELRAEIAEMDEAGFGGVEIQPVFLNFAAKLPAEREARIRSVGTAGFFDNVRVVARETARRGMWTDLTLGSGWPSGGGAATTPERASLGVDFKTFAVTGGQRLQRNLELPAVSQSATGTFVHQALGDPIQPNPAGWDERLAARARTVAVLAFQGRAPVFGSSPYPGAKPAVDQPGEIAPGTMIDLTSKVAPDGTLDWQVPAGEWQVIAFRGTALADHVVGNAIPGGSLMLDHLSRDAFDSYMRGFGEPLVTALNKAPVAGLRALFVDSLEIPTELNWSDDFRAEFQRRRGYDLAPQLPYLMQFGYINGYNWGYSGAYYGGGAKGDAARRDYWRTVGELIDERYYAPLNAWAASRGIKTRVQAHGAPGDLIKLYGDADIPETEQMIAQGSFDAMKLASSAANITGKRIVSSESFAAMGDPFWTNPQALIRKTDQMIVAGVNQIIYHGYPYKYDDRAFPGWGPFTTGAASGSFASFMNGRNTFWPYLRQVNGYIARLQYLSQTGTSVAAVAVLEARIGMDTHRPGDTPLTKSLVAAGLTFDFVNADTLARASAAGGDLVLPSGARYKAVVVADDWMRSDAAQAMAKAAQAGVAVIFAGDPPRNGEGLADFEADGARVRAAVKEILASPRSKAVGSAEQVGTALTPLVSPDVDFAGGTAFPYLHKRIGALEMFFFRNPADEALRISPVISVKGVPESWNPWTGQATPLAARTMPGGRQSLQLSVPPLGSALVVFAPDGKMASPLVDQPQDIHELPVTGPWRFTATGHDGAGKPVELEQNLGELTDWAKIPALMQFSGAGRYEGHLSVSKEQLAGVRTAALDLGTVGDVAEVSINGTPLPPLLIGPYAVDVRSHLRPGQNTIVIKVVNALSNSATQRPPTVEIPKELSLYGTFKPLPSGLQGPVRLVLGR